MQRRLFDLVPNDSVGTPTHCVIHAQGAPFLALLSQLSHHQTVAALAAGGQFDPVFFWMGAFSSRGKSADAEDELEEAVRSCAKGVVLAVDHLGQVFEDSRSLHQLWTHVHEHGLCKLHVCMPMDATADDLARLEAACDRMDMGRTLPGSASFPHGVVRASPQDTNAALRSAVSLSLRSALKWRSGIKGLAAYCGLLLQRGSEEDLGRLQHTLHGVAGIGDPLALQDQVM